MSKKQTSVKSPVEDKRAIGEPIITVSNLSKNFKDFWGRIKVEAVRGVSFEVKRGQVYGLLGPNGSGKSTTVKMLLGLLNPSAGEISILGHAPAHQQVKKRIGFLPEETFLYPYLNAEETLDFYGSLFSIPGKERKERVQQLLKMVGLERQAKRRSGEFSKGMARRLGLATALINDPELLILDEPTSGLDPIGCAEVKKLIRHLASRGKTILLTSHILADVEDVVDEVLVLYGGTVRSKGTLEDLLSIPEEIDLRLENRSLKDLEKLKKTLDEMGWNVKGSKHPLRGLEDVFLELIAKAREQHIESDGASSGGGIASYLGGETNTVAEEESPVAQQKQVEDKLQQLLHSEEKAVVEQVASASEKEEQVEEKLQDILPEESANKAKEKSSAEKAATATVDQDAINDKLKNLLDD